MVDLLDDLIACQSKILDQLPGFVFVKTVGDEQSQYVWANEFSCKMMGFRCLNDLRGRTDSELGCDASIGADSFHYYDQQSVKNESAFHINIFQYGLPDVKGLVVQKRPLYDENDNKIAVIATGMTIDQSRLDMFMHCLDIDHSSSSAQGVYKFQNDYSSLDLNRRQAQCLFWLLRGKSAREIGEILFISHKTVENHISAIKEAMGVHKRSQIFDYARECGYINVVPFGLWGNC